MTNVEEKIAQIRSNQARQSENAGRKPWWKDADSGLLCLLAMITFAAVLIAGALLVIASSSCVR